MSQTKCESCGMSIESGPYCNHCLGSDGKLQPFDERFERMVQGSCAPSPASPARKPKRTRSRTWRRCRHGASTRASNARPT